MRAFFVALIAVVIAAGVAQAAPQAGPTKEGVLGWINAYNPKRDVGRVPAVMKVASELGLLSDPEGGGMYVGFMAGVIGANPKSAPGIIKKLLVIRTADQWALVRAIAYSGHPDWRGLMTRFAKEMPDRATMAQRYLDGTLPTPGTPVAEEKATWKDRVNPRKWFGRKDKDRPVPLEERPEIIDVYWGYYYASRSSRPVERLVGMLRWSQERDSVERLTIGSMAKFTMAMNASRDMKLLRLLKQLQARQTDRKTATQLAETIEAAETMEISPLRKEALDRLEELKRMGPGSKRDMAWWGKLGQGAISLGCVAAAATGQVALGVPCVVGGAATSGILYYLTQP